MIEIKINGGETAFQLKALAAFITTLASEPGLHATAESRQAFYEENERKLFGEPGKPEQAAEQQAEVVAEKAVEKAKKTSRAKPATPTPQEAVKAEQSEQQADEPEQATTAEKVSQAEQPAAPTPQEAVKAEQKPVKDETAPATPPAPAKADTGEVTVEVIYDLARRLRDEHGKGDEVRAIATRFGSFAAIPKDKRAAVLAELEALKNG